MNNLNKPADPPVAVAIEKLAPVVRRAALDLRCVAAARMPRSGADLLAWMDSLAPGKDPAKYFLNPLAFPTLLFPLWLDEVLNGHADDALQADLAASSIAGYYFIRMIDDVADRSPRAAPHLLPALALLHARFEAPYRKRFPAESPFWEDYERAWCEGADAAVADASSRAITLTEFCNVSAAKVAAGRVPMLAVARRAGRAALPPEWNRLFSLMSRWHQMHNDVFDWAADLEAGNETYFLSEARRRSGSRSAIAAWVAWDGLDFAAACMNEWMTEMRVIAFSAGAADVERYLDARQSMLVSTIASLKPGLAALGELAALAGAA